MRQRGRLAVAEDRRPDLGQRAQDVAGDLEISLRGRLDAQRSEQLGRGSARIAGLPENRMQALVGKVLEHQVHDAPRIEGLVLRFAWRIHGVTPWQRVPPSRYTQCVESGTGGLNLRQVRVTLLLRCTHDAYLGRHPAG